MQFPLYALLVLTSFGVIMVQGDESALCQIWSDIEQRLRNEDILISCTTTSDCYGLSCSGVAQGYNISSQIQLHGCENPPFVEFDLDVPKLNVNNIKKKISQKDTISVTKNLNIEFHIERRNQVLVFGLFIHFLHSGSFPLLQVIPIISNLNFPINCLVSNKTVGQTSTVNNHISEVTSPPPKSFSILSKSMIDSYSNCSITNSTCSEEEICQQIDKMKPDGICVCIANYTRNEDGKCVHNQAFDNSSVSLLLTAILVPIFVVLILVAAIFITIRFRVFQHLRRRLRVQVYEHVLLGEDEEEEDMTNPVA